MNFNIGPRMMKTGLAVALAILVTESYNIELGIVSVITAVVAMQPSIMRSVKYVKEVTLSTILGIIFALAGAYTLGLHPVSIGITVILAIALSMKMRWEQSVNIMILTIASIMLSGERTINLIYLYDRLSLIVIGISAAFLVNMLIFPPNHQKLIYEKIKKSFEQTGFLLRVIPNQMMKVKELKKKEEELQKNIKSVQDYLQVIDDEKGSMLIRKRYAFLRNVVVFKQMLKVIELQFDLVENLDEKIKKVEAISTNQSFLVKKLVASIVEYQDNIILTYEGKITVQKEMQKESFSVMNLTINDLINELQQSEIEKWIDIFPVSSSIVKLIVELEHLDKLVRKQQKDF